ncbi:MAG TPA: chemotaxis protein CheC [Methanomassiliicoccales archaeon]|nr:chemotaxis protein CheC [Methanomassiliicoccales archaeon]
MNPVALVLDEVHQDALREMGSIGALHASSALSDLIGEEVGVSVSGCSIHMVETLPRAFGDPEAPVVGVYMDVSAGENGIILLVFSESTALQISDMVLHRSTAGHRTPDEDDLAVMAEVGNICASAYLSAIAEFLDIVMVPSPPGVATGMLAALLQYPAIMAARYTDFAVIIRTELALGTARHHGFILYIPDEDSQAKLQERFGIGIP